MKKCKFCEIAKGKREREHVISSDRKHVAVLDIYPIAKGQCMIIPRRHVGGLDVFAMPNKDFSDIFLFTKKVAMKIKNKLKPKFIFLVIEGTGVDHLHIKLYPVYKVKKMAEKRPIRPYASYYGYLTTRLGPRASEKELIKIANKISKISK